MNPNRIRMLTALVAMALSLSIHASAEWKEKVLYSFQGGASDGYWPAGGVVFDKAGNLYGATTGGGPATCLPYSEECGLVFELSPPAKKGDPWTETILYQFKGKGSDDASVPTGGVIIDGAGNLYGVTGYGGTGDCVLLGTTAGCGTVYELSPPAKSGGPWTETILYSFRSGNDGYFPWGTLTFDAKGKLYGATQFGGGKGNSCNSYYQYCGTVFELVPKKNEGKWTEKVLHSFAGMPKQGQLGDGANPNGGLIFGRRGTIYGTTQTGGYQCPHDSGQGCGSVFKLKPPSKTGGDWKEELLHRFKGLPDGIRPWAGVVSDARGNLFGTTATGGNGNFPSGTIFRLIERQGGTWDEELLYTFQDNSDGGQPLAPLTFDSNGDLYGLTSSGGDAGGGTIFRVQPNGKSWIFAALYDFKVAPDGSYPVGGLVSDGARDLYGATQYGGGGQACGNYGCGTVFRANP